MKLEKKYYYQISGWNEHHNLLDFINELIVEINKLNKRVEQLEERTKK